MIGYVLKDVGGVYFCGYGHKQYQPFALFEADILQAYIYRTKEDAEVKCAKLNEVNKLPFTVIPIEVRELE